MQKNKTIILLILSFITALLCSGIFIFFFKVIKNKNEHTGAVLTTLENKTLEKKNASELVKKMTQVESIHTMLNSHFVNPGEIDSFVDYLESLGTSSQTVVEVKSVEISKTIKNTLTVELSTEGGFSNVITMIKLLENMPYKVHIEQMFLNKSSGEVPSITPPTSNNTPPTTTPKPKEVSTWQVHISFTTLLSS